MKRENCKAPWKAWSVVWLSGALALLAGCTRTEYYVENGMRSVDEVDWVSYANHAHGETCAVLYRDAGAYLGYRPKDGQQNYRVFATKEAGQAYISRNWCKPKRYQ